MASQVVTRRHLPHWFVPEAFHFVTYRLAGTIPRHVLDSMMERKEASLKRESSPGQPADDCREQIHKRYFAEFDHYLDNNREIHWLDDPRLAAMIRENLYFHRGKKYELLSYCIMPNHVHVLLKPTMSEVPRDEGQARPPVLRADTMSPLADVMHSLKSYTSKQANKLLGRSGTFWQDESYDHWVRDNEELERIVEYIALNPVKAGLVQEAHQWFFCSAHDRFLQDGSNEAWLLS